MQKRQYRIKFLVRKNRRDDMRHGAVSPVKPSKWYKYLASKGAFK